MVCGAGGGKISRNKQQQGEILPASPGWAPALLVYAARGSCSFLRASLPHRGCKHKRERACHNGSGGGNKTVPKKKKKKRQQAPKVLTFKQCTGYCFSPAFRKSFVRDALPPASKRRAARSTPEKRQVQNKAPRLQVDQTKILPASSPEQQPELFSPLPAQARRPPSLPHPPSRAPTSASPPRSPPSAPQRAARGRASAHLPLPYT